MKRVFSALLVLCLVFALLPTMARAEDAYDPDDLWRLVFYYDLETGEVFEDGEMELCVLVADGTANSVVTTLAPVEGKGVALSTAELEYYACENPLELIPGELYVYEADSELGEEQGFWPCGSVTLNEKVYYPYYDEDGKLHYQESKAISLDEVILVVEDLVGESTGYTLPIYNSKYELCGFMYDEFCLAVYTDEETFYGGNAPTEPEPTEPPATEAPEPPSGGSTGGTGESLRPSVELPDMEALRQQSKGAKVNLKNPDTNTILMICGVVGGVVLLALIVVVLLRKKPTANASADASQVARAEEGTELSDEVMDTGVYLQFRNGTRVGVHRNLTIGRAPDNQVVIPAAASNVSGRHCEILVQNGAVYLRDMGSTNGTFINGHRVPGGQMVQLQPGMVVSLGGLNSAEAFNVTLSGRPM